MLRRVPVALAAVAVMLLGTATAAVAGPDQAKIGATKAFVCSPDAPLPPYHCVNVKSKGNTGLILVFEPDPRGPSEGISSDPKSDSRPCPHDPDADPDGTWWAPPGTEGIWVCHHKP